MTLCWNNLKYAEYTPLWPVSRVIFLVIKNEKEKRPPLILISTCVKVLYVDGQLVCWSLA